jgi:hypothetical protein
MPEQPSTFGRILVRVVLAEPRLASSPAVFQRVYTADTALQTVVADAWSHYRSSLDGPSMPKLYHGDTCIATLDPSRISSMTVGDLLDLPGQHTLGTVQLLLRCQL